MKSKRRSVSYFIDPIMHLALSFIGLAVLVTLVFSPSSVQSSVPWSKPLLGLVFGLICVSGIAAGLFPARCSETLSSKEKTRISHASKHAASGFLGHHPACGSFGAHVFRLKEKVYCAGCVGLILGGLFSIFGVVFYFFLGTIQCLDWLPVFLVGLAGTSTGLLQYHLFNLGKASIHLFVNTIFVVGVFLMLMAVDAMTHNIILDCYVIVLSLFWLYVRIHLSEYDHHRICSRCHRTPCGFV